MKKLQIIYLADIKLNMKKVFYTEDELLNINTSIPNLDKLKPLVAKCGISVNTIFQINEDFNLIKKKTNDIDSRAFYFKEIQSNYFLDLLNEGYSYCDINDYIDSAIIGFKTCGVDLSDWIFYLENQRVSLNLAKEKYDLNKLSTSIEKLISLSVTNSRKFYESIADNMTFEERNYILKTLENKSCNSCTNVSCNVENYEKIGLDENGKAQGCNCVGWYNYEYIGRSKILGSKDIYELKKI